MQFLYTFYRTEQEMDGILAIPSKKMLYTGT